MYCFMKLKNKNENTVTNWICLRVDVSCCRSGQQPQDALVIYNSWTDCNMHINTHNPSRCAPQQPEPTPTETCTHRLYKKSKLFNSCVVLLNMTAALHRAVAAKEKTERRLTVLTWWSSAAVKYAWCTSCWCMGLAATQPSQMGSVQVSLTVRCLWQLCYL